MLPDERDLTKQNIQKILTTYTGQLDEVGQSIQDKRGQNLFASIKRDKVNAGPYPHVTLFESANRIMTDLVILNGVKWLLENNVFPFDTYTVEFGNENKNDFDLSASNNKGSVLIGEAFNVAPSYFQSKKSAMLKKLRKGDTDANYKIIMVNHDAVPKNYAPKVEDGIYFVVVNITNSSAIILPN